MASLGVFSKDLWVVILDFLYPRYEKAPWASFMFRHPDRHRLYRPFTAEEVAAYDDDDTWEHEHKDWLVWREGYPEPWFELHHQGRQITKDMRSLLQLRCVCSRWNEMVIDRYGFYTPGFVGRITIKMLIAYQRCVRETMRLWTECHSKLVNLKQNYNECEGKVRRKRAKIAFLEEIAVNYCQTEATPEIVRAEQQIVLYKRGMSVFSYASTEEDEFDLRSQLGILQPWKKRNACLHASTACRRCMRDDPDFWEWWRSRRSDDLFWTE